MAELSVGNTTAPAPAVSGTAPASGSAPNPAGLAPSAGAAAPSMDAFLRFAAQQSPALAQAPPFAQAAPQVAYQTPAQAAVPPQGVAVVDTSGWGPDLTQAFREGSQQANLTAEQVTALAGTLGDYAKNAAAEAARGSVADAESAKLSKLWGDQTPTMMKAVERGVNAAALSLGVSAAEYRESIGLAGPDGRIINAMQAVAMAALGTGSKEPAPPAGSAPSAGASVAELQKQIDLLETEKESGTVDVFSPRRAELDDQIMRLSLQATAMAS